MSKAAQGVAVPPAFPPSSRACEGSFGQAIEDERYPTYGYDFPIGLLGASRDSFVSTVKQYLKDQGFGIDPDNTSGVERFFSGGRDFQFEAFVNENTGMASVGGNGPCGTPPFD